MYILYSNSTSMVQLLHSSSTLCSTKAYCIRNSAIIMSLKKLNIVANNTKLKVRGNCHYNSCTLPQLGASDVCFDLFGCEQDLLAAYSRDGQIPE